MKLSAVIPVYNSQGSLEPLLDRLVPVLETAGDDYEVIMVNDHSRDGSWAVVERLAAANPRVRGINLSRNFGQHNALLCGLREAGGDIVVTLDDDLQNPPEEIPRMLDELNRGFDVVYGVPDHIQHQRWRRLSSRISKFAMSSAMGVQHAPDVSAFRVLKRELVEAFAEFRGAFVSIDVLLSWATVEYGSVRVRHDARTVGSSNYNLRRLVVHAVNMITGYSTAPLRFASLVGFSFTLLGVAVLVYVFGAYVYSGGHSVQGFPFLASVIAIFAGAQLFALGIMGEYLGRIHARTTDRPPYVVRETTPRQPGR